MEESSIAAWVLKPINEAGGEDSTSPTPPALHSIAENTTKGPSIDNMGLVSTGGEHDQRVPVSGGDIVSASLAAIAGIRAALSKGETHPEKTTTDAEAVMTEEQEEESDRPIFFIDSDDDDDEDKDEIEQEEEEKSERNVPMEVDGEKQMKEVHEKPLIDYLCALNACSLKELQQLLYNVKARKHMVNHLQTFCLLRTAHLRERNQSLRCDDLSTESAHDTYACGGYLDLTVRQYFFAKHGIKLKHPCMPCLVEYGGGKHASYFPLEVINVVVEPPPPRRWMRVPPLCGASGEAATTPTLKRVRRLVSYWPSEADDQALDAIAKGEATLLNPTKGQLKRLQERERGQQKQVGEGNKNNKASDGIVQKGQAPTASSSNNVGTQTLQMRDHRQTTKKNTCHLCCAAPSPLNRW